MRNLLFGVCEWVADGALVQLVISDPDDKNFDLEAYLTIKMADEAK